MSWQNVESAKRYGGRSLTYREVIGIEQANGELKGVKVRNTITGEEEVKITYRADDVTKNYDVTLVPGTLTITAPTQYRLTINYWYGAVGGATAAAPFTALYDIGAAYNVASPVILGYTASVERETGTMGNADITLNVIYTANEYTLTINYIFQNGAQAAPTYQEVLDYNEAYNVVSPAIDGYTASTAVYNGNMPARNVTYTVIYLPDILTPPGETVIEDYDTPLGLDVSSLSVGDMYE